MNQQDKALAIARASYTQSLRDSTIVLANGINLDFDRGCYLFSNHEVVGLDSEFIDRQAPMKALYDAQSAVYLARERMGRVKS